MIEAFKAAFRQRQALSRRRHDGEDPLDGQKGWDQPNEPIVPGALHDVGLHGEGQQEVRRQRRWGYAEFEYDPRPKRSGPATRMTSPPQEHDAKCGFACHTIVADKDYVFTHYPER